MFRGVESRRLLFPGDVRIKSLDFHHINWAWRRRKEDTPFTENDDLDSRVYEKMGRSVQEMVLEA